MVPNPDFTVTSLLDTEYLINDKRQRHYNGILIGTYTRPT